MENEQFYMFTAVAVVVILIIIWYLSSSSSFKSRLTVGSQEVAGYADTTGIAPNSNITTTAGQVNGDADAAGVVTTGVLADAIAAANASAAGTSYTNLYQADPNTLMTEETNAPGSLYYSNTGMTASATNYTSTDAGSGTAFNPAVDITGLTPNSVMSTVPTQVTVSTDNSFNPLSDSYLTPVTAPITNGPTAAQSNATIAAVNAITSGQSNMRSSRMTPNRNFYMGVNGTSTPFNR